MAAAAKAKIIISAVDKASGVLKGIGGALSGVGRTAGIALAAAGAALTAFGVASVKVASTFEDEMAILGIAARSAGASVDEIRQYALKMGAQTVFSAQESAEAMTDLYKAGLTATDVMGDMTGESGVLKAAMDLAAASGIDLATASQYLTVAMSTYGRGTEDAVDIANNFVQAADASVAEVNELAQALVNVGPVAAQFGWSLEDTNTALAILSQRGIKGGEAGTALRSMMTNLMRPTDSVTEALNELNVSLYNADGTMRAMPDIIGQLSRAMFEEHEVTRMVGGRTAEQTHQLGLAQSAYNRASDAIYKHNSGIKVLSEISLANYNAQLAGASAEMGRLGGISGTAATAVESLTEEQRNQYIQTLAGTYGMRAMNTLLAEGVPGWEKMEESIGNAAGASVYAEARMATFSGVMEELGGTIETLMITVGTPLIENFLKPLAAFISSTVIPAFQEWVTGALVPFMDELMTLGAQVGPQILGFLQQMADTARPLIEQFAGMTAGGQSLTQILAGGLLAAVKWFAEEGFPPLVAAGQFVLDHWEIFAVAAGVLAAAILIVTHPIVAVVAALTALYVAWTSNWGGIQDKTFAVVGAIQEIIQAAMAVIQTVIGERLAVLQAWWSEHGDSVMTIVNFLWSGIQSIVNAATSVIGTLLAAAIALWQSLWSSHGSALTGLITILWEGIKLVFSAAFEALGLVFDAFAAAIEGDWTAFGEFLRTAWDTIWSAIISAVSNAGAALIALIASLVQSIIEKFTSIDWGSIGSSIIEGIKSGIVAAAGALAQAAANAARAALDAALSFLGAHSPSRVFMAVGRSMMEGTALGILAAAGDAENAIRTVMGGITATQGQYAILGPAQRADTLQARAAMGTQYSYGGDTVIINDRLATALYLESRRRRRIERVERM